MIFTPSFGRWEDLEATERFFAKQANPFIRQAAHGILTMGDDNADVDLCKEYEAVTGKRWNSRNQNPRGFCVGFGNAKTATLATAMMAKAREISWPGADVAIEPVYGGMRYEVGAKTYGSDINRGDDGGVGAWAAEWLLKWGVLLMQQYEGVDLSNYSENRCDTYGRSGVPDALEPIAKQHPLTTAALCSSAEEVWSLIGQWHPVVHCSNQGFTMQRTNDGTCRASGSWAHCAGWNGRFTLKSGARVIRYENSWDGDENGNGYLGNPIVIEGANGPISLNGNQFLVVMDIVDRMCRNGRETYAMTGPKGFTARRGLFLI
jgi:hypothetical protein